ncbi:hypothetical protein [Mesorhizobium sp. M7A.F.Ce.TU.012.03.2.1]|uniref:hypothetical protein n=1 Tax=Mesorhizobium sp. M7A.F.Ce.TU.012.03.2.1 TaxID=2493681 RepID=UPI000FDAECCE|nr:hypothetical protein [Mesorhizobium sp. M7A.F.Ce.TU.012.03.2.1]AZV18106.1 hypothetical protein EJ079_02840 [Mesorhizobium sp. M7A.F.Ce.TU.012.03.2.1]
MAKSRGSIIGAIIKSCVLAISLFLLIGVGWLAFQSSRMERDRTLLEWASLAGSTEMVEGKSVPEAWSAGLFVSEAGLNTLFKGLDNATVAFDPESRPDEDTVVTVGSFRVAFEPGFASGDITLMATSAKRELNLEFKGTAAAIFNGIDRDNDGSPTAVFSIHLIDLEPQISWYSLDFGIRSYASDLLQAGIMAYLADSLTVRLPFDDQLKVDLELDHKETVPVREPKAENYIDLRFTMLSSSIEQRLSYAHPLFLDGGLWLLASADDKGQQLAPSPDVGTRTAGEVETEIRQMRAKLAAYVVPEETDVSVWLRGETVGNVLKKIQELPLDKRTVTVISTKSAGRLAEDKWRDDILGEGGAFAELTGNNAVSGKIELREISSSWTPDKGLTFKSRVHADANAKIHAHVDPLIGGGAGTTAGMLGSADLEFEGTVNIGVQEVEGHKLLVLLPESACKEARLQLTTDGKLKIGSGWTSVPSVGGIFKGPVGLSAIPPQLVATDLPILLSGRSKDGKPLVVPADGDRVLVTTNWQRAKFILTPSAVKAGKEGYVISAGLTAEYSDQPDIHDRAAEEKKLREALVKKSSAMKPCPGAYSFAVKLGSLEFGPNNEIVKFLRNAWSDITKGPGKNNEAVKILKTATDAMIASGEAIDDATKAAVNEINGFAAQTLGQNSEAAKAVNAIASAVSPPTVGTNADGGVTVKTPAGSVSTGGGHGGLGVTVKTPIGGLKF